MEDKQFNLYFAGSGTKESQQLIRELGCGQLLSQLNERASIMKWVDYMRSHPECTSNLFIDSGAYSAYTKGKVVDVDDYIKLINDIGDVVTVFAQVDKIPQVIDREPTTEEFSAAAGISWDNYLYMWERIKPEYRHKLMPVYHFHEDEKWLRNMLEYRHPDGSKIDYIGLAVSTVDNSAVRTRWLEMCFGIIKQSSNPDVKTHGFGLTDLRVIEHVPLYSSDSTKWVLTAAYGSVLKHAGAIHVTEATMTKPNHIEGLTQVEQKELDDNMKRWNLTREQLANEIWARQAYNIHYLREWELNYKYKGKTKVVAELF